MMCEKAVYFDDTDIASQIMNTDDVLKINNLGRQVLWYNDTIWNGVRQIVIYEGLFAKFSARPRFKCNAGPPRERLAHPERLV